MPLAIGRCLNNLQVISITPLSMLLQAPTLKNIELKYKSLRNFFDDLGADIICLQETKLTPDGIPAALSRIPGFETFWTCSQQKKGYSGCATFVRMKFAASNAAEDDCLPGAHWYPSVRKMNSHSTG
jgi:hypothetical protein